ncbi:hypothetical protein V1505DRAFT_285567, partial [Lipomyces doorenjongii]
PSPPAPLASRSISKSATNTDFVNPLLWVLFTTLATSRLLMGQHQSSNTSTRVALFLLAKPFEAIPVADSLARPRSLSGRIVTTT